jgi:hypothetical protein
MQALVVIGVEMREFATNEERFVGPARRGPIEEKGPRPGHRDAAGAFTHPWEREYSLGQTPAHALIGGLLVDLHMGQRGCRNRPRARSDR